MLPVSAIRAVNLKRVVYINVTPGMVVIHMDTGEAISVPGFVAANTDYEEEYQKARIAVIVYSTNNGSKTLIGAAYILEIVEAANVATYKMVGGATLQIRGGGDFAAHLRTVKDAEEAARVYSPPVKAAAAIGQSMAVAGIATNDPINITYSAAAAAASPVESVSSSAPVYECALCGVKCQGRKCMGCKSARYCSVLHQKLHWDGGHWQECGDDYP